MNPVTSYTGQSQQSQIRVPARIAYRLEREEGCWSMPPYAQLFPPPPAPAAVAVVPPPVYTSDLWSAQQTYPL